MNKLIWDQTGEKIYETGVECGVLYPQASGGTYPKGVAWNGLSNVTESPSGAEASPVYADNQKYLNLISVEEFGATVEAYTYPDEFMECDGSKELAPGLYAGQQNRKAFGMVYKTLIGNDVDGTEHGYKIHMIYNALAAPSEKSHSTTNESPEAMNLSWELSTIPIAVGIAGVKPTATLTADSTEYTADTKKNLEELEKCLFGHDADPDIEGDKDIIPFLPLPADVIALLNGTKTAQDIINA